MSRIGAVRSARPDQIPAPSKSRWLDRGMAKERPSNSAPIASGRRLQAGPVKTIGVHVTTRQTQSRKSAWLRLVDSDLSDDGWRALDHPVDGLVRRGSWVPVFVHRDVPGIEPPPGSHRAAARQSRLVRKSVPLEVLRAHTHNATAGSRWCVRRHRASQ